MISVTLGSDKGYDAQEFLSACQDMSVIAKVAVHADLLTMSDTECQRTKCQFVRRPAS